VPPYDLRERTRLFALAIVKFCRVYPRPTRPAKPQDNYVALPIRSVPITGRRATDGREPNSRRESLKTTRINSARMKEIRQNKPR